MSVRGFLERFNRGRPTHGTRPMLDKKRKGRRGWSSGVHLSCYLMAYPGLRVTSYLTLPHAPTMTG